MVAAGRLAVVETHPIQYRAPLYRAVQNKFGIPVTVIYGSDFSVAGYRDAEFGACFAWDTDLLSGYTAKFLSRVADGGARSAEEVSARGLREALLETAPAAALLVGYSPRFHRAALAEVRRVGCPIFFRGETTDHARRRGAVKKWIRDRALRWTYRRCSRLLYVGKRSLEHFRRLGCPEEKLSFSPYCVDGAAFRCGEEARAELRQATRRRLGLQDGDIALLFSGKLSPRKGPDLLLKAVRLLPEEMSRRVCVLFLGDGEMKPLLEADGAAAPAVNVRFLGFQNQTLLSPYYHAADLLVLPSRFSETWGLVVNEAMSHGLPCVVSEAVGCAPDLIELKRTGEVVGTGSEAALAEGLRKAMDLAGRADVRGWCRELADRYSLDRAAEGIARAFEQVVGREEVKSW